MKRKLIYFFLIASSWVLGHFLSACFAGFVSDVIGRKKSLLLDTAVFCVGFIILATGHLSTCLIIARLLLGYPLVSQVLFRIILKTYTINHIHRFSCVKY